jgi:hypothetical protein
VFACRPAKNVQKIEETVVKKDTIIKTDSVPPVIVSDKAESKVSVVDSNAKKIGSDTKEIFEKIVKNKIPFNSFNARVRVQYQANGDGEDATAYIRLKRDSLMWISLRGPLGIEGFRVLITRDSVKVMDLLKKTFQLRTIDYLQEITGIPFDFFTLQDFVIGNPIFIDSNIVSYKAGENNELLVLMDGSYFKNLVSLDNTDFKILHSKLVDVDTVRNRTSDISFADFQNSAGVLFSTKRKISVAEKSKLDINLDFKQYSFNQSLTFPFNIPKNYKRL